jgi:hypothetical protein
VSAIAELLPEADDGLRTRDLKLGKLALYQLSYVRSGRILMVRRAADAARARVALRCRG